MSLPPVSVSRQFAIESAWCSDWLRRTTQGADKPPAYAAHAFAACDFPFSVTRLRVAIANAGSEQISLPVLAHCRSVCARQLPLDFKAMGAAGPEIDSHAS